MSETVDSVVQVLGGALGGTAIAGYWLRLSLKKIAELEAKVEALNAKVEARDAARLHDHQTALRYASDALIGIEPPEEEPKADKKEPSGRVVDDDRREPTGRQTPPWHRR